MERRRVSRQLTKAHLEHWFAHDGGDEAGREQRLEHLERQLARIRAAIERLEEADETAAPEALRQARELLAEFGSERRDIQEWAGQVFADRYAKHASIPNHVAVERLRAPIPVEKFNTPDERAELADAYGFRFERFNDLLHEIGFWQRIGPLLEELPPEQGGVEQGVIDWTRLKLTLDHPHFAVLVNAINGGAQLDYESAFGEAQVLFDELKQRKFSLDLETVEEKKASGRSPLSVPDILMAVTLHQLNALLPGEVRHRANSLSLAILDESTERVSNDQRAGIYRELIGLYEGEAVDSELVALFDAAVEQLELPEDHEGYADSLEDVYREWDELDAVIPLHHYDDARCSYWARAVMADRPGAFFIPSGGHLPHKSKRSEGGLPDYSEADETVAALLQRDYSYQYDFPGLPEMGEYPPVNPWDILYPDEISVDTSQNALNVAERLGQLQRVRGGGPLKVLIMTTGYHSARAWKEFRMQLPEELVDGLKVVMYRESPPLQDAARQRRTGGIADLYCEYVKRLYGVATDPPLSR